MMRSIGTGSLVLCTLLFGSTLAGAGNVPLTVDGSVHSLANRSKTIALDQTDKPTLIVRFDAKTSFKNVPSAKDILPGENITIEYLHEGDDNLATRITRVSPNLPQGVGNLTLKELEGLVSGGNKRGSYLLIDARPASKYAAGHIPTAISIPLPALEREGAKLLPPKKGTPLVFYCGGVSCGLSHQSAKMARSLGYSRVKVYSGGEQEWIKAEHYTIPASSFLQEGNIVLVDLREPKAAAGGHIPGAINVPLAQLDGWERKFPSTKDAQLVFYGGKESDVAAAISTARDWGYSNVTGFPGGTAEWVKSGSALSRGAAPDRIDYRKKQGPNEMGPAEFLEEIGRGTTLVDVRTPEEYAKERIAKAINIPAEQMAKRFTELPKGKELVFYCNTGIRAEMAFDVVRGKDYSVKFLNANVEFKEDGSYSVTE